MTEIPSFGSNPSNNSEHFTDTDPYQETLRQIHDRFLQLTQEDSNTSYSRTHSIENENLNDPIILTTVTRGSIDNVDMSSLTVAFPTETTNRFGTRQYVDFTVINHDNKVIGGAMGSAAINPSDFPPNLVGIYSQLERFQQPDADVDTSLMTSNEYKDLWSRVNREIDTGAPKILCEWATRGVLGSFSIEQIFSANVTYEMNEGMYGQPVQLSLTTSEYELFAEQDENGKLLYRYTDAKDPNGSTEFTPERATKVRKTLDGFLSYKEFEPGDARII